MGLFNSGRTKRSRTPAKPGRVPLASGRRLQSSLGAERVLEVLEAAVSAYKKRPYEHTPLVVPVGYEWLSAEAPPAMAYGFDDVDNFIILAAFWRNGSGTTIGLFPLGSGDDRLANIPAIGHMKLLDASLTSTGTIPANSIALKPPQVTDAFLSNLLTLGGYPATPLNMAIADAELASLFKIKAWEFMRSRDERAASRFVETHGHVSAQTVLDDLAAWNAGVVPYIQELPYRIQGIVMTREDGPANFWKNMERE